MKKVNYDAKLEHDFIKNYKVLQTFFDKRQITKVRVRRWPNSASVRCLKHQAPASSQSRPRKHASIRRVERRTIWPRSHLSVQGEALQRSSHLPRPRACPPLHSHT